MLHFDPMERTAYVTNFSKEVDKELLLELFIQMGPVYNVTIKTDPEVGKVPYAFVEFEDEESVLFACDMMDGLKLYGRPLSVKPRHGSNKAREWHDIRTERGQASTTAVPPSPPQPEPLPMQVKPNRRFTVPSTEGKIVEDRNVVTRRFTIPSTEGRIVEDRSMLSGVKQSSKAAQLESLIGRINALSHGMGERVTPDPTPPARQGGQVPSAFELTNIYNQGQSNMAPKPVPYHAFQTNNPIPLRQLQFGNQQNNSNAFGRVFYTPIGRVHQTPNAYDRNNNTGYANVLMHPPKYAYKYG